MKSFENANKLLCLAVVVLTGLWLINLSVHANPNDPPGTPGAGGAVTIKAECLTKGCSGAADKDDNTCSIPVLPCLQNKCGLCDGAAIITVCWQASNKDCHTHKAGYANNFVGCGKKRSTNCVIAPGPNGSICKCPSTPGPNDPVVEPCLLLKCTHTTTRPLLP